ncbi:universal stress protein [Archaeoglobus neptunius]|uniref:universal stress protein n=1 Tax=Archaeoglobus neptunius TaxID=2798580 RepID=UPI00192561F2|nr:universal stress protein [Archaeoglobus neptunius]
MAIVVAVDHSERTPRILDFAVNEAKLRNEKLLFIHSLYGGDKTDEKEIEAGERLLDYVVSLAQSRGVEAEKHLLVRGKEPEDDIVEFAEEVDASLIIIGVRKRRPAGKLLFGSVAQQVILNAKQPVVCIK